MASSVRDDDASSLAPAASTPASSPPLLDNGDANIFDQRIVDEEIKARQLNVASEQRVGSLKKPRKSLSKEDKEQKARDLDNLLQQSLVFTKVLAQKMPLGQHEVEGFKQPECMKDGGTMHEHQLQGMTWMYEVCFQGMSGILADEMGLGKSHATPFPFPCCSFQSDRRQAKPFKQSASLVFCARQPSGSVLTSSSLL